MKKIAILEIIDIIERSNLSSKNELLTCLNAVNLSPFGGFFTENSQGQDTANSLWHTFTIRKYTTAQAGIFVEGIDELLKNLKMLPSTELIYTVHFDNSKHLASIFFRQNGIDLVGAIALPRRQQASLAPIP